MLRIIVAAVAVAGFFNAGIPATAAPFQAKYDITFAGPAITWPMSGTLSIIRQETCTTSSTRRDYVIEAPHESGFDRFVGTVDETISQSRLDRLEEDIWNHAQGSSQKITAKRVATTGPATTNTPLPYEEMSQMFGALLPASATQPQISDSEIPTGAIPHLITIQRGTMIIIAHLDQMRMFKPPSCDQR